MEKSATTNRKCILKCKQFKSLSQFPKDDIRKGIWVKRLRMTRSPIPTDYVCNNHFSTKFFTGEKLAQCGIPDVCLPLDNEVKKTNEMLYPPVEEMIDDPSKQCYEYMEDNKLTLELTPMTTGDAYIPGGSEFAEESIIEYSPEKELPASETSFNDVQSQTAEYLTADSPRKVQFKSIIKEKDNEIKKLFKQLTRQEREVVRYRKLNKQLEEKLIEAADIIRELRHIAKCE